MLGRKSSAELVHCSHAGMVLSASAVAACAVTSRHIAGCGSGCDREVTLWSFGCGLDQVLHALGQQQAPGNAGLLVWAAGSLSRSKPVVAHTAAAASGMEVTRGVSLV